MRSAAFVLALLAAGPAAAQTVVAPPNVTAGDVATTPLENLNLKKDDVPPVLLAAQEDTYTVRGLRSCRALGAAITELDGVLGPDIDVAADKTRGEKRGNAVGLVAKSVISSFIPFSGVIREVTGAAAKERQWQVALYAGAARRAFLKGYGQARGCRYPARAASAAQAAALRAAADAPAAEVAAKPRKRSKARRRRR